MQKIVDNQDGTLSMGKSTYTIRREPRGCREKIWIHDEDPNRQAINYRNSNCLIKFNRNDVSCENYGEILYYAFLKSCGARCTKYELASLYNYEDGKVIKHDGVICPTYMHRPREFEFSGYELQRYQNLYNPEADKPLAPNTVVGYIQCVRDLMLAPKEEMIRQIKIDLIKMAFFDYVTCQTDRHWGNVSFIFRAEELGNYSVEALRVASSYDNGCCFLFKRKEQALKTIANQLKVAQKLNNTDRYMGIMENISDKCVPCLGIITSLYQNPACDGEDYPFKLEPKDEENWEQTFLNELCFAISKDEDLKKFFRNKKTFKLDNAREVLEHQGDTIPEELMYLASEIVDYRVEQVFRTLEKYKYSESQNLIGEEMENGR